MDTWASISYDDEGNIIPDLGYMDAPLAKPTKTSASNPSSADGLTNKQKNDVISLKEFSERIPDEAAAIAFVEEKIWGNNPRCPHCGMNNVYRVKSGKPMSHRCRPCKKYFSIRVGTVMEQSNLPLRIWVLAIHLMHTGRKGTSALQLHKMLGVCYETAWFLCHRIREAMKVGDTTVGGVVEVDETYIGGKVKNMHKFKKPANPMENKYAVVGLKDHNGNVIAFPVANTDFWTLQNAVLDHVKPGDTVYTDGHPAYAVLKDYGYNHDFVNHSTGQYVNGLATTNGIESFWALLKRGYIDTFHWMSWKHLFRYVNEFAFRHNSGKGDGFETIGRVFVRMVGERLPYKKLIGGGRITPRRSPRPA